MVCWRSCSRTTSETTWWMRILTKTLLAAPPNNSSKSFTAISSDPEQDMSDFRNAAFGAGHDHIFLGAAHEKNESRRWGLIALCAVMMVAEIVGGSLFGSLALVADGLHMSTHAGALLLAALAYTYARKFAHDRSFTFGTGKFGDLAGYTSAIVLAMIALLIGYEAVERLLHPVAIDFNEAIPIASLGLAVNIASAWLLSGGHHHGHGHDHSHGHAHDRNHHHDEEPRLVTFDAGTLSVAVFEDGVPPRFRITAEADHLPAASDLTIE